MTNSHCMPAPVQLESMRQSTVDEYDSLTPQGGGGAPSNHRDSSTPTNEEDSQF